MGANFSRFFVESPGNTILAANYNGEFDNILTNLTPAGVDDASSNLAAFQAVQDPGEVGSEVLPTSTEGELRILRNMANEIIGKTEWYESPVTSLEALNTTVTDNTDKLVPVGTIVGHYDFNAAVTFTDDWLYCDGSVIADAASPINGQTLPDLSNRYLVGFGTEGGGDIDTAAWATAPVGLANHTIAAGTLSHSHTVNSHTHTGGSLAFKWMRHVNILKATGTAETWDSAGTLQSQTFISRDNAATTSATNGDHYMINDTNSWDAFTQPSTSVGSSGSANPGTDVQLAGSVGAQPRSIRVRWIMRVK